MTTEQAVERLLEQRETLGISYIQTQEPGILQYQGHRSLSDPRLFFLYEQYVDEAAYQAHVESPHAKQYAWAEGIPNLESRERFLYETLDL